MLQVVLAVLLFVVQASSQTPVPQGPPPSPAAVQAKLREGDAAGARVLAERLAASTPNDPRAWNLLGTICQQLKDYPGTLAAFQKMAELQPDNPQAMFNVGVAFAATSQPDAAFLWLGKARATRRIDMTQMDGNALLDPLRKDPRFASLMPTPADFTDPFVEPTTILGEWTGEAADDEFGWIARSIGDVDGDGAADFVTSAPSHAKSAGRIYVYSSKRGTRLWTADGAAGDNLGIGIESAGDINGDGIGDVLASAPGGSYAKVYSGNSGTVLLTLRATGTHEAFGRHVAGIADWNGDRVPDLLVGAPGGSGAPGDPAAPAEYAGRAYVFSGKDGTLITMLTGERGGDQFGAALGGSQTPGTHLIAVGAPNAGAAHTGKTYVFRSLTAPPAFAIDADDTGRALGAMFIGVPGDVDGDHVEDVYVSDWSNAANGPGTGRVYVYSGKTGARLRAFTGETAGEGFGTSQSTAGDVDGDGTADLIVGSWQYGGAAIGGGRASLYSGKTGDLLKTYTCRIPGDTFGFDAVGLGDIDKDGTVDFLITSGWSAVNGFHSGRVFLISSGIARGR